MAVFRVERRTPLPVPEVWRRVTDWPRHTGTVPFTVVTVVTPPPTRVGTRFVARTGAGRLGFDDVMEVVRWEPPAGEDRPARCRLEKRGRVVLGWAEVEVRPHPGGAVVVWTEEARVRGLPRFLDRPTAAAGRLVFSRVVASLLR